MKTYPIPDELMKRLKYDYEMVKNHPQYIGIRGGTRDLGVCAYRMWDTFYLVTSVHISGVFRRTTKDEITEDEKNQLRATLFKCCLGWYFHQMGEPMYALREYATKYDEKYEAKVKALLDIYLSQVHKFIDTLDLTKLTVHLDHIKDAKIVRMVWSDEKENWIFDIRDLPYMIERYKKYLGGKSAIGDSSVQKSIDEWEERLRCLK